MQQIASGLGYPIGYVYASVPIGGIFLILQTLARLPILFNQIATGAQITAQED